MRRLLLEVSPALRAARLRGRLNARMDAVVSKSLQPHVAAQLLVVHNLFVHAWSLLGDNPSTLTAARVVRRARSWCNLFRRFATGEIPC